MNRLRLTKEHQELLIQEAINQIETANTIAELGELGKLLPPLDTKKLKKPTIFIRANAYLKMQELVMQSDVEISWHGLVKRDIEKNAYLIYDILVFPQVNSATSTNTDQTEYAKWVQEIMMDEDESKFDDMRMHGHSHVNMNVFSSGVDDEYQKNLITNIKDGDYYIFLILNKKHDICALLYDYNQQILFETKDLNIRVITDTNESISVWAANQIKNNCKKPPYTRPQYRQTPIYNRAYTHSDYFQENWDDYLKGSH